MINLDWKELLKDLIKVLRVLDDEDEAFYEKARQLFTLDTSEAFEKEIRAAESRLGIKFPPSYRAFLKASNGWPEMGVAEPGVLWAAKEIQWLRDQDPETIERWSDSISRSYIPTISPEEHLYYRDVAGDSCWYREAYLQNILAISAYGDACILLLSPEVVDENGEWECWKLASWLPGAARYPSFAQWMIGSYKRHVEMLDEEMEIRWHSPVLKQLQKEEEIQ
jgi:SMI1 / KNR4 family (SUKH-1)